jgi:hypothetical protein
MIKTVDTYNESNVDGFLATMRTGSRKAVAQSFTGKSVKLDSCKFLVSKISTPTGNVSAKVYNATGTHGTSSVPTGDSIAESDTVDVTTISSGSLVTFTFSGENKINLSNGAKYILSLEYPGDGNTSHIVGVEGDSSSPTHSGNYVHTTDFVTWTPVSSTDLSFYVYGETNDKMLLMF